MKYSVHRLNDEKFTNALECVLQDGKAQDLFYHLSDELLGFYAKLDPKREFLETEENPNFDSLPSFEPHKVRFDVNLFKGGSVGNVNINYWFQQEIVKKQRNLKGIVDHNVDYATAGSHGYLSGGPLNISKPQVTPEKKSFTIWVNTISPHIPEMEYVHRAFETNNIEKCLKSNEDCIN